MANNNADDNTYHRIPDSIVDLDEQLEYIYALKFKCWRDVFQFVKHELGERLGHYTFKKHSTKYHPGTADK